MPATQRGAPLELFAVTAPGLESIAAGELHSLGVRAHQEVGGVSFAGDLERLYLTNLWLRTASRVVLRLGRFHAQTFYELERRTKKLPWADFLPAHGRVQIRVTCRKSRLYHSDAVADRVLASIARAAPPGIDVRSGGKDEANEKDEPNGNDDANGKPEGERKDSRQLFVVRIVDDQCEISVDSSGELLHRRGYRQELAKAPLRETLAAAMLLASGWQANAPLVDPMCGSGTIPIEAALMARRIAPGFHRRFQFMEWSSFDEGLWNTLLARAKETAVSLALDIRGADRDAGAIEAARRNAERAGVANDVQWAIAPLSESLAGLQEVAHGTGWIITNPPYGIRVGESSDLRNLYAALGSVLKGPRGWRLGLLAAEEQLARQLRAPVRSRFASSNGGIPVNFLASEKPEADR